MRREEEMKRVKTALAAIAMSVFMGMTAFAATGIGLNLDWKYAENKYRKGCTVFQ